MCCLNDSCSTFKSFCLIFFFFFPLPLSVRSRRSHLHHQKAWVRNPSHPFISLNEFRPVVGVRRWSCWTHLPVVLTPKISDLFWHERWIHVCTVELFVILLLKYVLLFKIIGWVFVYTIESVAGLPYFM